MRRKDKQISDRRQAEEIIAQAQVCRLAMVDGDRPYVVPLCFGYDGHSFFFHSAPEGRKIDLLRRNPRVCIELEAGCEVISADSPCNWSMRYASILAVGKAAFVEDPAAKREALGRIMAQYGADAVEFSDNQVARTAVIQVAVDQLSVKGSGLRPDAARSAT